MKQLLKKNIVYENKVTYNESIFKGRILTVPYIMKHLICRMLFNR